MSSFSNWRCSKRPPLAPKHDLQTPSNRNAMRILLFQHAITQGHKNPARQVAVATWFCTVALTICGHSVWNKRYVILLAPRILRSLVCAKKKKTPASKIFFKRVNPSQPQRYFLSLHNNRVVCTQSKAIPLQAWTGPEGSRRLRLPDFKTIGTWRW